mmetsp:Transcript_40380/g.111276  ORF Transcript_40380/g.111276 Transcript_40380/m.111276 type:complete len:435 (+) Transcript_40380:67-1371(+)
MATVSCTGFTCPVHVAARLLLCFLPCAGALTYLRTVGSHGEHAVRGPDDLLDWHPLDREESIRRKALCMDGTTPGIYFRPADTKADASAATKWILNFRDGGWCSTVDDCIERLSKPVGTTSIYMKGRLDVTAARGQPFSAFNQVLLWYCDGGMFAGTRDEPIQTASGPLYFQGRRILVHMLDVLKANFGMNTATEVLLTGGSAGGWATYLHADFVAQQMPSTVTKFRAAPMDGWWPELPAWGVNGKFIDDVHGMFTLHNMEGVGSEGCRNRLPEADRWRCMFTDHSYAGSKAHFFVIQALDGFVGAQNLTVANSAYSASKCANGLLSPSICTSQDIMNMNIRLATLKPYFDTFDKSRSTGQGFFLTSCNDHVFYRTDKFNMYASNGVTPMEALRKWWNSDISSEPAWYLPCQLHAAAPYQCEPSCAGEVLTSSG